jgi:hypothetical protein
MPNSTSRRLCLLPVLVTAATALLVGCGGSGGSGGHGAAGKPGGGAVASVAASAGSSAAGRKPASSSTDPDAGRPQIRLDSSQHDINAMMDAWTACLKDKGGPDALLQAKEHPANPTAKACLSKLPLDPPELDPATNPHYSDDLRVMVRCMNSHGIRTVASADGDSWSLVHGGDLGAPGFQTTQEKCQVKAFGHGK